MLLAVLSYIQVVGQDCWSRAIGGVIGGLLRQYREHLVQSDAQLPHVLPDGRHLLQGHAGKHTTQSDVG